MAQQTYAITFDLLYVILLPGMLSSSAYHYNLEFLSILTSNSGSGQYPAVGLLQTT